MSKLLKNINGTNSNWSEREGKKGKKNKKGNNNKNGIQGQRVKIKELVKNKNIKKVPKDVYIACLLASMRDFEKEIKKAFEGNSKVWDDQEEMFELFCNERFAKRIKEAVKQMLDQEYVSAPIMFVIGSMFVSKFPDFDDEDISKLYSKLVDKCYKKEIEKVTKIIKPYMKGKNDKSEIKMAALALVMTSITISAPNKVIAPRIRTFLSLCRNYLGEDIKVKELSKLIEKLYKKHSLKVFIKTALGEKKTDKNSYGFDIMTDSILKVLNDQDKDDIKELLKEFIKARKKNNKIPCRTNLLEIDDKYKKVLSVCEKLEDRGAGQYLK